MGKERKADVLQRSYEAAEDIMKQRAKSFYEAFRRLPEERFQGVCALYAFNRYADDLADGDAAAKTRKERLLALEELERNVKNLYHDEAIYSSLEESFWPAFLDTVTSWGIPLDPLLLQIEGQKSDLSFQEIKIMKDLKEYSRKVAGSVGRMMVPLLALDEKLAEDPNFLLACEELGMGMQITNILRDVGEDLRERNRIYLPSEFLETYGITKETLRSLSFGEQTTEDSLPSGFIQMADHLMELANPLYEGIASYLHYFHPAARTPLLSAALLYQGIHGAIRKSRYNVFTKRCYTDSMTRAKLLLKAKSLVDLL